MLTDKIMTMQKKKKKKKINSELAKVFQPQYILDSLLALLLQRNQWQRKHERNGTKDSRERKTKTKVEGEMEKFEGSTKNRVGRKHYFLSNLGIFDGN